jgi:UDPglucose--hexose-1-phosphate uridylyltransferase
MNPELRQDPLTGQWSVIAPERAARPIEVLPDGHTRPLVCPFCPGHEAQTPHALRSYPAAPDSDRPGWRVRVVPNKYPSLRLAGDPAPHGGDFDTRADAYGAAEVIIDSPDHAHSLTDLPEDQVRLLLEVYADRLRHHQGDPRLAYGLVFKNVGAAAGASLEHTHSQILVVPQVPELIRRELDGAAGYDRRHGRCLACDLIERERRDGRRVVTETRQFVVLTPFASRMPYEMAVWPKAHTARYERLSAEGFAELAGVLRTVLGKLERAADRPAYNYLIHTAPLSGPEPAGYHWHLEVLPRTTGLAGFELGCGWMINPLPPELAAARLREATP